MLHLKLQTAIPVVPYLTALLDPTCDITWLDQMFDTNKGLLCHGAYRSSMQTNRAASLERSALGCDDKRYNIVPTSLELGMHPTRGITCDRRTMSEQYRYGTERLSMTVYR